MHLFLAIFAHLVLKVLSNGNWLHVIVGFLSVEHDVTALVTAHSPSSDTTYPCTHVVRFWGVNASCPLKVEFLVVG